MRSVVLIALIAGLLPATLRAQGRPDRFGVAAGEARTAAIELRPLRIAKWTVAAATVGAAAYGFLKQREADDEYEALERDCQADAELCNQRLPDGAFTDPALEQRYQRVVDLDEHARAALIGTQVGVAAAIVLFVLDLGSDGAPPNIPYDPEGLDVRRGSDGELRIGWHWRP